MPANPRLFGGGYRDVLDNPQHTAGLDRGSLRITGIHPVGDTLTRVVARLDHPMDAAVWRVANATIRLEIPGLDEGEIVSRVYTVREVRDAADGVEVVVDFVRHAHVSPVLRWLDAAAIGDTVPIIGPRQHFLPAFLPGRAVALFADETAIPALASILRDWHEGYEGTVWIEARDAALVDELSAPAGVTLHWLAAGAPGALVRAARTAPTGATVWAAGERDEMRDIRRLFRDGAGLPRDEVVVFGYWKRGVSNSEIDRSRLEHFRGLLIAGGPIGPVDDLDIDV